MCVCVQLSMSNPRRRPSIMRKKELKYRRELSSPSSGNDQLQLVKEASSALSKERPSHVHSGVRSHLMQQKRSEQNLLHSLPPNWSPLVSGHGLLHACCLCECARTCMYMFVRCVEW